jgi:hypothetical protein
VSRNPKPVAGLTAASELLVYTDDEGAVRIHVRLVEGTVWLM